MKSLNESILKSFKDAFLIEDGSVSKFGTDKRIEGKIVAENEGWIAYKIDTFEDAYRFHGLANWPFFIKNVFGFDGTINGLKNALYFFVRKNITDPKDKWNYIALIRNEYDHRNAYLDMNGNIKFSGIPEDLPEFDKPPVELQPVEERFIQAGFKKNANGEFDIDGDFYLSDYSYLIVDGKLGVKFGKVRGNFVCGFPEYKSTVKSLISLDGCPKEVGGSFDCSYCSMRNLEGCPEKVGGDFDCYECDRLVSLKGCPNEVGGDFRCDRCKNLKILEGCPREINGNFDCGNCENLTSLKGCPEKVSKGFSCSRCENLKSLEGCPEKVGRDFYCTQCGVEFTEDDVRSLCDVKGRIEV